MANVHTLRDINSKGYRLGSTREIELEEALRDSCISNSELIDDFKNYQKMHKKFIKNSKRDLNQISKDKEELSKYAYQLIDDIKRLSSEIDTLTFQNNQLQISNAEYEAKDIIHLKKIKSLQSMIKILNSKLESAQKDAFSIQENLSKTETENLSLKSKMDDFKQIEVELERVRSELDHLKSEAISKPIDSLTCSTIVGGNDEGQSLIVPTIKNIVKSDSQSENVFASNISIISESSNSLRPYLVRRKNIEDIEKINDDDEIIPIPKLSDSRNEDANASETNNSETSKDIMLDTHINSDPQISIGGIEAIPIVTSKKSERESSNSLRPYLVRRKNIEDIEKINDDDEIIPIPKLSDSRNEDANASETNNSETSKDIMLDTHINSDPQISIGGIEAIPIVTSTLTST
ncbi:hypothetical protein Glove_144g57 [Diversispora epigaea]|uniref:Uncharacterized protein n=1 Tax=Diversispora epigaea TaxID=1348612 RepID=A0A397J315_9GLOM|nr:hypothetical protein Glove_144g57 [Diversispora epigaea]